LTYTTGYTNKLFSKFSQSTSAKQKQKRSDTPLKNWLMLILWLIQW